MSVCIKKHREDDIDNIIKNISMPKKNLFNRIFRGHNISTSCVIGNLCFQCGDANNKINKVEVYNVRNATYITDIQSDILEENIYGSELSVFFKQNSNSYKFVQQDGYKLAPIMWWINQGEINIFETDFKEDYGVSDLLNKMCILSIIYKIQELCKSKDYKFLKIEDYKNNYFLKNNIKLTVDDACEEHILEIFVEDIALVMFLTNLGKISDCFLVRKKKLEKTVNVDDVDNNYTKDLTQSEQI